MTQAMVTDLTSALSELETAARRVKALLSKIDEDNLDSLLLKQAIKKEGIGGKGWKTLEQVAEELKKVDLL